MALRFQALEYTINGTFIPSEYEFNGSKSNGWEILRNNRPHLTLGEGYELLKTMLCGICATDLDRKFYPFALPQIIGHEVVVKNLTGRQKFVVEINDTPYYRGSKTSDIFCSAGLPTHSPGRMVLGIDRLPGGFGPYILAPCKAVIPIENLSEQTAVLIEPFAAALHAVNASPPQHNDTIAVLGPRRLGTLLIAALSAYKHASGKQFKIYALARRQSVLDLCRRLGADVTINVSATNLTSFKQRFDIVYDTTGSALGFDAALSLAKRELHLKSTTGQPTCGLDNLTAFVVDELSLLPFNEANLEFKWAPENRPNETLYLSPNTELPQNFKKNTYRMSPFDAQAILDSQEFDQRLPRFDIAVASTLEDIDSIIRPSKNNENALVRPRGAILFQGNTGSNPLLQFIARGGRLTSSRCGDFRPAIRILEDHADIADKMAHYCISHMFPVESLDTAFQYATHPSAIKVIVKHM